MSPAPIEAEAKKRFKAPSRQLSSRSPIGVIGDASTASAEKGERLLAAISADVAEALLNERLWSEPI